jgi:hypothetical protein
LACHQNTGGGSQNNTTGQIHHLDVLRMGFA